MTPRITVRDRILRMSAGRTTAEIALIIGCTPSYVRRVRNGNGVRMARVHRRMIGHAMARQAQGRSIEPVARSHGISVETLYQLTVEAWRQIGHEWRIAR
jgi:hypothetical protein